MADDILYLQDNGIQKVITMTTYKVTTYISTIGYSNVIDRIYFVDAKNAKHAQNKVRYICRKYGKTAIVRDVAEA